MQAHYRMEEVVMVANSTAIKATIIIIYTINTCQLKIIPNLYILQYIQPQRKTEVELKEPIFWY